MVFQVAGQDQETGMLHRRRKVLRRFLRFFRPASTGLLYVFPKEDSDFSKGVGFFAVNPCDANFLRASLNCVGEDGRSIVYRNQKSHWVSRMIFVFFKRELTTEGTF
jgi:hypothetical protein